MLREREMNDNIFWKVNYKEIKKMKNMGWGFQDEGRVCSKKDKRRLIKTVIVFYI